jgi:hypothetical protein
MLWNMESSRCNLSIDEHNQTSWPSREEQVVDYLVLSQEMLGNLLSPGKEGRVTAMYTTSEEAAWSRAEAELANVMDPGAQSDRNNVPSQTSSTPKQRRKCLEAVACSGGHRGRRGNVWGDRLTC